MYQLYIIYSQKLDRFYVGYTEDLPIRLQQHNRGDSVYTSKASDWQVKYSESFASRKEAMDREKEIKKKKSRKFIEWLISNGDG